MEFCTIPSVFTFEIKSSTYIIIRYITLILFHQTRRFRSKSELSKIYFFSSQYGFHFFPQHFSSSFGSLPKGIRKRSREKHSTTCSFGTGCFVRTKCYLMQCTIFLFWWNVFKRLPWHLLLFIFCPLSPLQWVDFVKRCVECWEPKKSKVNLQLLTSIPYLVSHLAEIFLL